MNHFKAISRALGLIFAKNIFLVFLCLYVHTGRDLAMMKALGLIEANLGGGGVRAWIWVILGLYIGMVPPAFVLSVNT